ncbi:MULTISPECIES: alpha-N-arabinofuranosidase [unclassified Paenibacillus]|uniref:arabinosylfuranosidase ArfA n=1 Tax=unclassified Paenibacillus TaxID=185978 RepID=UPI001C10A4A6|nr:MULTISPECIES: alpha-N-arabinofuranosidase [unclassified Paenibacillus]MBU5444745.1 alpha-N-arabinofuranosidase [Paenibacillus sp. MSJ-34]CAH0121071.1 Intracellular exo-alpha-(1->5)-L-arabinofuranosidase [Paenibacillus sp. CECT 9249]
MKKASIIVSKDYQIGEVSDTMFGSFVEHMGSVVYNGIYEPDHKTADEHGFRQDVMDLVKELNLSVVRYPGGNFTSGYNWEDGIGPKEQRPIVVDPAWKQIETNQFGLNEFMQWARMIDAEAIMTINLGTRGIEAAKNILEYCNFEGGTKWSDLRKSHGIKDPYKIKTWCLGNELDGEWQIARKTAAQYGELARETAKVMKWIDPSIELVAVGSSARHMPTFPEWDRTVLEYTYEYADMLSLHQYIGVFNRANDTPSYLAMPIEMEKQIEEVIATCDYVKGVKRSNKVMKLSFDEWNVWREPDVEYVPWQTGHPLDWVKFRMEDALVFGSAALSLLRHADRIQIACQSLLVNTEPLILTEKGGKAWRNPTYYPFQHISRFGRGTVLRGIVDSPKYDTPTYTDVPVLDSAVVYNEESGDLTVFAVNRGEEALLLQLDLRDFEGCQFVEHIVMKHERLDAVNTADRPDEIQPAQAGAARVDGGRAETAVDPYSWNVIRFHMSR